MRKRARWIVVIGLFMIFMLAVIPHYTIAPWEPSHNLEHFYLDGGTDAPYAYDIYTGSATGRIWGWVIDVREPVPPWYLEAWSNARGSYPTRAFLEAAPPPD